MSTSNIAGKQGFIGILHNVIIATEGICRDPCKRQDFCVKATDHCNSLLLWREEWIYLEVKSNKSLRYFIAIVYGNQHPKNSYQALGMCLSLRRPCDMAGCAVGRGTREAGHLLPAVTLALGKEDDQSLLFSPPGIRQDCCPSLHGQLCWTLKHSDADLKN